MLLSIIIPVFNEEHTVKEILKRVVEVNLQFGIGKEIIILNDGSNDKTEAKVFEFIPLNPNVKILYKKIAVNKGKGNAIKVGLSICSGNIVVIQDSDLEYNPNDYNKLLELIVNDSAEIAYGNRFHGKNLKLGILSYIGNKGITGFSNLLSGQKLNDIETGLKMFKREVAENMILEENRFGFEPEFTIKAIRHGGIKIKEVNIEYTPRNYRQGKKIGFKDGVRALYCVLKYRFA